MKILKEVINMPLYPSETFLYTIHPGDTLWLIAQRYHTTINTIAAVNPGIDINNLYIGQVIRIRPEYKYIPSNIHSSPKKICKAEADLNNYLRKLWEEHVFWTRLTILSIVFELPDVDLVTKRLLQNPKDFELALSPLYGNIIASKFAELLTNHLVIAAQLVKAAKAGDNTTALDAEKSWYANADEIAAFLASINPYWSQSNWKAMLYEHLALTKTEAVNMITKNYSEGISTFDKIENQALEMADVMSYGIVKQFVNKFNC